MAETITDYLTPGHKRKLLLMYANLARGTDAAKGDLGMFIERVVKDDHGVGLKLAPIHMQWVQHLRYCWARGLKALILAPFGHGKCGSVRHLVQLADGSRATAGELLTRGLSVNVLAANETTGTLRSAFANFFDNGIRKVLRLNMRSGRVLEVTEEHPLYRVEGWTRAADLQPGDFIARVRDMPALGTQPLRPGEAHLLGALVADGSVTGGAHSYTKYEDVQRALVADAARSLGFAVSNRARRGVLGFGVGIRPWLRGHDLAGKGAYEKRVPAAIFTAPNAQVAEFICAYLSGDGTVASTRGGMAEGYSVSKDLLLDIMSLLLRFGVQARVVKKLGRYKGAPHESWRLVITGADNLRTFRQSVGLIGEKGRILDTLDLDGRGNPNHDVIPLAYRERLRKTAHWHKVNTGLSLDQMSKTGTSRATVLRAAVAEDNPALLALCNWAWDRIESIDDLGEQPTVGVEVPGPETYIGGDMLQHNSSTLAVPLIAWSLGRDTNLRIKIITNDDSGATKRVERAKEIIESPAYRTIFRDIRRGRKWAGHEAFLSRTGSSIDPSIHARGVLTTGIGGRADIMIFDDIVDQKNSMDPIQRAKVLQFVESTWLSRLEPDARVLYIGTPWHLDDATHHLMQRQGWCTLVQRVSVGCDVIEQELIGAPDPISYPLVSGVIADAPLGTLAPAARGKPAPTR